MSDAARIRVLVLDDHEVVRHGLIAMIDREPDMQVVAEARTAEEALPLFRAQRPDVTLTDLRLPGQGGAAFIATVRGEFPEARFVVLTTFDSDEDIYQAFSAGASAFVLKDSFRAEILQAVRSVHAGGETIPGPIAQRLEQRRAASSLTPRELDVLRLLARGRSNKLIAAELGIGEGTIKTHLASIFAKLEVTDRTSAATVAIARGILRM